MFSSTCFFQEDYLAELPGNVFPPPPPLGHKLRLTGLSGGEAWNCIGDGQYWKWSLEKQSSLSNPTHYISAILLVCIIYITFQKCNHNSNTFWHQAINLYQWRTHLMQQATRSNWLLCSQFKKKIITAMLPIQHTAIFFLKQASCHSS